MKMVDVNEEEQVQKNVEPVVDQATADQEIIQKTVEALQRESVDKAKENSPKMSEVVPPEPKSKENTGDTGPNFWPIQGLPSKGRLYPKGTEILGRPLKVIEVKKLSGLNENNADYIINDILKRTIKGVSLDDMFIADKLFIVFWLRANTFRESGYVVDFTCSKCEKESKFHFELDNLEIQYLDDEFNPNNILKLKNKDTIKINFLTVGDTMKINRFVEINSNTISDIDEELLGLAAMIQSINGEENNSLLSKYNYVLGMEPTDFAYISSYIEKYGMGIKPYVNVKCTNCGGISPTGISFRGDFFLPSYQFE